MYSFVTLLALIVIFTVLGSRASSRRKAAARRVALPAIQIRFQELQPPRAAETEEDRFFELVFDRSVRPNVDKFFYTKIVGVTFPNKGGSNRQELIEKCKPCQILALVREAGIPGHPEAIRVLTEDNHMLGYLAQDVAQELAAGIDFDGAVWLAVVRRVFPRDEGKNAGMVIRVCRFKPEYMARFEPAVDGALAQKL